MITGKVGDCTDMSTITELLYEEQEAKQLETRLLIRLADVRSSLASLQIKIAETKNINRDSAVYSIPTEVLAQIFRAGSLSHSERKEAPFPILVSGVSRHFRDVAIHEPTLWTRIQSSQKKSSMDMLDMYLSRSGACLLDVKLKLSGKDSIDLLVHKIVALHDRLRRLNIQTNSSGYMYNLLSAFSAVHLPYLEHVRILMRYNYDREYDPHTIFAAGAPRLSSLHLHQWSLSAVKTSLHAVTSLTIERGWRPLSFEEFKNAIDDMPALKNLVLTGDAITYDNQTHVHIPSLTSLDFTFIESEARLDIFKISTPSLESLILRGATKDRMSKFVASLGERGANLRYSALERIDLQTSYWSDDLMHDDDIVGLIAGLPTIEHVTLGSAPGSIFYWLSMDSASNPSWPNLQSVTVRDFGVDALNIFCLMISHRTTLGRPKLALCSSLEDVPSSRVDWLADRVSLQQYSMVDEDRLLEDMD